MRALKLLLALLLLICGVGLITVGISGIQTFGSEGQLYLESPNLRSGSESYALVIDVADVETGIPWSEKFGETTVGAKSLGEDPLFVGLAATPQLDEYLRGVPYDVVRNEGQGWQLSPVPGTQELDPPRAERFWTRRGMGTTPTIPFKQAVGGKTTFVTMNADGSPGLAAVMTVGYRSSVVYPVSLTAIGVGAVLVLFAVVVAFRSRKRRSGPSHQDPSHQEETQPESVPISADVDSDSNSETESVRNDDKGELDQGDAGEDTADSAIDSEAEVGAEAATDKSDADDSGTETENTETGDADDSGTETENTKTGDTDDEATEDPGTTDDTLDDSDSAKQNDAHDDVDNDKVDSGSTDIGDYDSWFRDGKTK